MTLPGKAGAAFAPAASSSPPHHVSLCLLHALVSQGGGERKNVNGTFPDSHPSWVRRKKGGFRLGCLPAGKVGLSSVAWPPGARASLWGGWRGCGAMAWVLAAMLASPGIGLGSSSKSAVERGEAGLA